MNQSVIMHVRQASQRLSAGCFHCSNASLCAVSQTANGDAGYTPEFRRWQRGELIYRDGDDCQQLYCVKSGSVKLVSQRSDGDERLLSFHFRGEVFGLEGLANYRHYGNAIALEETLMCVLPLKLLADDSSQRDLLRMLAGHYREVQQHLLLINRNKVETRLATFLL